MAASLLIAIFASFVALDLVRRPATGDRLLTNGWVLAGSLAMGTGVWSMHFIGMLADRGLGPVGYDYELTLVSWLAAVLASGLALTLAGGIGAGAPGGAQPRLAGLAAGALLMATGVCSMHYLGMMAMRMSPPIVWDPGWVVASFLVALLASVAALGFFRRMRGTEARPRAQWHVLAAVSMGLGISGMHYAGMAAATFVEGSVCLAADELSGQGAGTFVGMASVALLSLTLLSSQMDKRTRTRSAQLADSLRRTNAELQRKAFGDPLTGLPNRRLFEDRLSHAAARCDRYGDRAAVLFIDLDGFKPVNDSWGHEAGDQVLREIAARLRDFARESDTVARLGGDEFVVLVEGRGEVAMAGRLAQRLIDSIRRPIEVGGHEAHLSCSIGIAVYPQDGPLEQLMGRADAAMYEAKRAGRGTYRFHSPSVEADAPESREDLLAHEMQRALEAGELELFCQPVIDGRTGKVAGAEALAFWRHPVRGLLEPSAFLPPAAHPGGVDGGFGDWLMRTACTRLRDWQGQGLPLRLAIPLPAHRLTLADVAEALPALLDAQGVDPARLLLETDEAALTREVDARRQTFERLADTGLSLSVDGFGGGRSSLSWLQELPVGQLKLGGCLIRRLPDDTAARAMVQAVVQLAHALELRVLAEGVETSGQHDVLCSIGCDEMQGPLYGPPLPAAELEARIRAPALQQRDYRCRRPA